ncbi:polysaccharide deacetylase family protein [Erythrobacter sp. JK5]|uniref:polysaccharide deacetylase family protein n=1 Tax=Erythrobacter sp. JK5 TaxID=2829500 RepID=UPI001BA92E8A|nr:polysaccharide deacetylase family protein [Erythrobacter sp. JK5]QUL36806.1 polysaccharide deacetylase family protein [Erythrobacter sp. JK5]
MTCVYITIDTEYSSGLVDGLGPADRAENYARSIACITPEGPAGITHKLKVLEEFGQKAVFFVDPMPALIWGVASIEDIVAPILEAGQDVQLHCHTEWLAIAGAANPLASGRTGQNLFEFPFDEQCALLAYGRDVLVAAGAPAPIAFRAGNYGANDDTLRALAEIGLRYDSSHCPALPEGASRISLGEEDRDPVRLHGVIEVPVGSIGTLGGGQRHAQITALTLAEMKAAIRHARDTGHPCFTLVSHSFELINRRKLAVNKIVRRRFTGLCHALRDMRRVKTGTYRDDPPVLAEGDAPSEPLPASPVRTSMRLAEQLVSNTLYGAL